MQKGISASQAIDLLLYDLEPIEHTVARAIRRTELSQNQYDALVLLTFDIGAAGLRASTMAKMINQPQYRSQHNKSLSDAWQQWAVIHGKRDAALIMRRAAEWRIYSDGVYEYG